MTRQLYVNLPVRDLSASTRFYEAIGCTKNPAFSDENASSMQWSDTIVFQLLTREYFRGFTQKPVADAHAAAGMLLALSQDSREAVDAVVEAAAQNGGKADVQPPKDLGFMYLRTFEDPDGHVFEPAYMDMSQMPG